MHYFQINNKTNSEGNKKNHEGIKKSGRNPEKFRKKSSNQSTYSTTVLYLCEMAFLLLLPFQCETIAKVNSWRGLALQQMKPCIGSSSGPRRQLVARLIYCLEIHIWRSAFRELLAAGKKAAANPDNEDGQVCWWRSRWQQINSPSVEDKQEKFKALSFGKDYG